VTSRVRRFRDGKTVITSGEVLIFAIKSVLLVVAIGSYKKGTSYVSICVTEVAEYSIKYN